jgi:hypothetical protein
VHGVRRQRVTSPQFGEGINKGDDERHHNDRGIYCER